MLATPAQEVVPHIDVELIESVMLEMPQVECPVVHHFGDKTYIREVTLPAGATCIGHAQKFPQLNIMLTGKVAMVSDDGQRVNVLQAPMIFMGAPGRKIGHIMETCTWLNVYPNEDDERDVEKLEARWLDKSATFKQHQQEQVDAYQQDREDFLWVINAAGFDESTVRAQSEYLFDQIPMPDGYGHVTVRQSPIEGQGIFITTPFLKGSVVGPASISGMRTPIGRFANHSATPNCKYVRDSSGDVWMVAIDDLAGCKGGDQGTEATVDYAQVLGLSGIHVRGESQ